MKLKGQMGECPRRFLKFLRKIRTAVAFIRSAFLTWASIYSCKQLLYIPNVYFGKKYVVLLFRYFVSWFRGLQTALEQAFPGGLHLVESEKDMFVIG